MDVLIQTTKYWVPGVLLNWTSTECTFQAVGLIHFAQLATDACNVDAKRRTKLLATRQVVNVMIMIIMIFNNVPINVPKAHIALH